MVAFAGVVLGLAAFGAADFWLGLWIGCVFDFALGLV